MQWMGRGIGYPRLRMHENGELRAVQVPSGPDNLETDPERDRLCISVKAQLPTRMAGVMRA